MMIFNTRCDKLRLKYKTRRDKSRLYKYLTYMKQDYPKTLNRQLVASSHIFKIEQVHLQFANGAERMYERLLSRNVGAVLIVPFLDVRNNFIGK